MEAAESFFLQRLGQSIEIKRIEVPAAFSLPHGKMGAPLPAGTAPEIHSGDATPPIHCLFRLFGVIGR